MYFTIKISEVEQEVNIIAQQVEQCTLIIDLIKNFPEVNPILDSNGLLVSKVLNLKKVLLNRQRNLKEVLEVFKEIDYTMSIYSEKIESALYNLDEV